MSGSNENCPGESTPPSSSLTPVFSSSTPKASLTPPSNDHNQTDEMLGSTTKHVINGPSRASTNQTIHFSSSSEDSERRSRKRDRSTDIQAWRAFSEEIEHILKRPALGFDSPSCADILRLSVVTNLSPTVPEIESEELKEGLFTKVLAFIGVVSENVPTIMLNPLGDTIVILRSPTVGDEGQHIRCALQSLKEAAGGSSWEDLLKQGKKFKIPSEDSHFGILFMLRVAHGVDLTRHYPKAFTFEEIVKVASVIHKYDASKGVRKELVDRIPVSFINDSGYFMLQSGWESWLFVAWALGLDKSFQEIVTFLIRHTPVTKQGVLLNVAQKPLQGVFPTVALDHIRTKRGEYLEKLLKVVYEYLDELTDSNNVCFAPDQHRSDNCADLMCGSFIRTIKLVGLGGVQPDVKDVEMSIHTLEKHLKDIEGTGGIGTHQPYSDSAWEPTASEVPNVHPNCQQKLAWQFIVNRELKGIGRVPLDFLRYIAHQGAKRV